MILDFNDSKCKKMIYPYHILLVILITCSNSTISNLKNIIFTTQMYKKNIKFKINTNELIFHLKEV